MRLAVITVTYNDACTIQRCLNSVAEQGCSDLAHIVINGESSDGTTEILNEVSRSNFYHLCEADDSLWNAMNKGISFAQKLSTDYICFLNADDVFGSRDYVRNVCSVLVNEEVDFVYGQVNIGTFRKDGFEVKRRYPAFKLEVSNILKGLMPPHPGCFHRLDIYHRIGLLSESRKLSPDFHFFAMAAKHNASYYCMSEVSVLMDVGGISNSNYFYIFFRALRQARTTKLVFHRHRLFVILFGKFMKLVRSQ